MLEEDYYLNKKQDIIFVTNIDQEIVLSKTNPLIFIKKNKNHIPYVIIKKNINAKILRAVYYQLINKFLVKGIKKNLIIKSKGYEIILK